VPGDIQNSGGAGWSLGVDLEYGDTINGVPVSITRIPGAAVAIGFDETGAFGTIRNGIMTGLLNGVLNSFTVRAGPNLNYVSTTALSSFDVASYNAEEYKTLRFRLHNAAQYLSIYHLVGSDYELLTTVNLPLSVNPTTNYNVGIAYSGPFTPYYGDNIPSIFSVKNFHIHGVSASQLPTNVNIVPNIFPSYVPPIHVIPPAPPVPPLSTYGLSANEGSSYTGAGLFTTQDPTDQYIVTQVPGITPTPGICSISVNVWCRLTINIYKNGTYAVVSSANTYNSPHGAFDSLSVTFTGDWLGSSTDIQASFTYDWCQQPGSQLFTNIVEYTP
jgi:hypothetical protein